MTTGAMIVRVGIETVFGGIFGFFLGRKVWIQP
jgi:hypothetical protein